MDAQQNETMAVVTKTVCYLTGKPNMVTAKTSMLDDLYWDSIDMVEFLMKVEDAFSVDIPVTVAEQWLTIQNVVDWLMEQKITITCVQE